MTDKKPELAKQGSGHHDDENLKQISMTISAEDLERVNVEAKKQRISRAAFIRRAILAALPEEN